MDSFNEDEFVKEEPKEKNKKRAKPETKEVQRERVRECEQRRRDRIIESFDSLQNILPTNHDARVTKESILLGVRNPIWKSDVHQAVEHIQELRDEIEKIKKQTLALTIRLSTDPLNTYPLTQDEIQAGFNALYIDTMGKLNKIESKSYK
jgi:hypothetical protein